VARPIPFANLCSFGHVYLIFIGSWFHYLCKNVPVANRLLPEGRQVLEVTNEHQIQNTHALRQADYSWLRSAYFLKCFPKSSKSQTEDSESPSNASSATLGLPNRNVTLLCFGAPPSLQVKFKRLLKSWHWEDALNDPFILFQLVVDELFLQLDKTAWNLSAAFGNLEHVRR
jgi:hypothetical protein